MGIRKHDIAKKQHRERSQPLERRRYGLLEKKKDYKLRSQDYHQKEARIKLLRRKANERNPDEFHHGMLSRKTNEKGILVAERGNEVLSNDAAKLLKTQDFGYVKTLSSVEAKKIEKLEADVLFEGEGKHTVFVDDEDSAKSFSALKYFDTDASMLYRRDNRLRKSQMDDLPNGPTKTTARKNEKQKLAKLKELEQRMNRQAELRKVQQEMDLQRELMKKGPKKKMVDREGNVTWKWKNVRKK
ncbi:U3 small nucleolar RNA-associated protein 11 [Trichomonascus vanleenenianus]|uniref:rRNA-processing protein UTP11 n=1 Tax=Trichomonascus vanleenenianus TaxID=2268995 RepID=UPI003ECA93F3